jgi:hypothetical protein
MRSVPDAAARWEVAQAAANKPRHALDRDHLPVARLTNPGINCIRRGPIAGVDRHPRQSHPGSMGDVLKYEVNPNYTREVVTLLIGTNYPSGAVLGRITASGKYTLSAATGADGAQVAVAVLLYPVNATLADAVGIVVARGPSIMCMRRLRPIDFARFRWVTRLREVLRLQMEVLHGGCWGWVYRAV